jgi:hypothetical protein
MANPNWRAEVDQALMEQDRSDSTSKNIFCNRDRAYWYLGSGILAVFIGIGLAHASHWSALPEDDRNWCEGMSVLCWICAAVEIPMSCLALYTLRRKSSTTPRAMQRVGGPPPIGW